MKWCPRCRTERPLGEFGTYVSPGRGVQVQGYCRECNREYLSVRRAELRARPVKPSVRLPSPDGGRMEAHRDRMFAAIEDVVKDVESLSLEYELRRPDVEAMVGSRIVPLIWNHALLTAAEGEAS